MILFRILAAALILNSGSLVMAQELIKNPSIPDNPNSGRILRITEIFRISDKTDKFFFKFPNNLCVS
jgi:hypothetical protein